MSSPWASTRQPTLERPWLGMAMLAAVPVLSLILVRLFWSGSSLWFLTVGIVMLGAGAIVFLARRTNDQEIGRQVLAPETPRLPLVLAGLGVLFLAMLILPNFAGGDSTPDLASPGAVLAQESEEPVSETAGVSQASADSPRRVVPAESFNGDSEAAASGGTYVVGEGDTLWDIAVQFDVSVTAIVEANDLEDETAISIDQELVIPVEDNDETATRGVGALP
ncbi:MAG: LysM peptidoglycan-binding domain-containing protein [Chloroflexi bacterium]|nr:LysM peptidoglycan-binding domain-containing protein [Chloroflexota bacterium]MCI0856334.1 LysM peptidoglycan-binding domain-containing protein [Chloroflexota bacterium]